MIDYRPSAKLRHLRLVTQVAEGLTVSEAAFANGVTQSAATQAIHKVEAILGVALFVRGSFGLKKNQASEVVSRRFKRADGYLRQGIESLLPGSGTADVERRIKLLNWTQIHVLLTLDGVENLSDASKTLGTSRAAIYRVISEIEDLFGPNIISRRSHSLRLAETGLAAAPYFRLAIREAEEMASDLGALQGQTNGIIRIGATASANARIVPVAIATSLKELPMLTYEVRVGDTQDLLHQLARGIVDVVVSSAIEGKPNFHTIELCENRMDVVCRGWHPLVGKPNVTERDLATYPWIVPTAGSKAFRRFNQVFENAQLNVPAGIIQTDSYDLIRALLASSDCLAMISESRIAFEGHVSPLSRLPFKVPGVNSKLYLVQRDGWLPTRAQIEFIRIIKQVSTAD
ncbi:LysR family transcriptional regulator (plasmid) [Rhizobium sp. NIBRBAC000502774]|nr:LysR family transcriptional regulator [Rhizobium sp. NIBRBAC000502774]